MYEVSDTLSGKLESRDNWPFMSSNSTPSQMPHLDLSIEGVRKQWSRLGVARAIAAMEAEEPWAVDGKQTVDGRSVEEAVSDMASKLSGVSRSAVGTSVESMPDDIIDLMGRMHSGRAMSMLRWVSEASDTAANDLLRHAANTANEFGALLLERVTSLERRALLARVFSPQRMTAILDILDEHGMSRGSEQK